MAGIKVRRGWRVALLLCAALGLLFAVAATSEAGGQACAQGSGDARAVCVEGNPNTCAELGFPGFTFVEGAGDANVGFSSDGTFLDVTVASPNVQLVVAVKGGPHLNLYGGPGSDYHAPLVGGPGNIPTISHYFGCYILTTNGTQPPPPGNGFGPGDPGTPGQPGTQSAPGTQSTPAPAVVGQPRTTG